MSEDLSISVEDTARLGTVPLRARQPVRLHEFFERACDETPDSVALACGPDRLTYRQLDERANRMAHVLLRRGVRPGQRVGILVPRSVPMYLTLLAVLKTGATFVPIDPAAPADRVRYVAEDAALDLLVVSAGLEAATAGVRCPMLRPEQLAAEMGHASPARPRLPPPGAEPCYVIYTSGSTGRPKGVAVGHASICNFIEVVAGIYGVRRTDRVYQGMTIAFDFSVEEVWPTWAAGATLVAGPTGADRIGSGLARFLRDQRVTILYCVPTVLATIDCDLPGIRTLLVGGEACPAELVQRWSRPGRRMLNTYGPTEATVTATWCQLLPGRPVTIGRALPTYRIVLLNERLEPVADGAVGEICIGGPGVALGYLNRPELTAERFLDDPRITGGGRLYRTGDLGRVLPGGEIEYLGRADSEVKIRGHRIDLQEIESILLEDPQVAGAAVAPHPDAPTEDLVAYLTFTRGARDRQAVIGRLHGVLRQRLTAAMIPGYVETLDELPMMPSGKVDRGRLPRPSGARFRSGATAAVAPATPAERALVAVWAELFGTPAAEVSVTADFFDLGGHSLLAARAVSILRERGVAPEVSVADVYAHPTIRALAATLAERAPAHRLPSKSRPRSTSTGRLFGWGTAQLGAISVFLLLLGAPVAVILGQSAGVLSLGSVWALVAVAPVAYVVARFLLPVVGVRLLSRRVAPGEYPLWSAAYFRVWLTQGLLALAPLGTMSGSPLLPWYLRLLGARVGRRCQLASANLSLPSLLTIGDDVSVGYGARVQAFHVKHNRVHIAPVALGAQSFVGANAVVEPGAELGAGAGLAEMSAAAAGQRIPAGQYWSGSPSRQCAHVDPLIAALRARPSRDHSRPMRAGYLAAWLFVELLPLIFLAPSIALGSWMYLTYGAAGGWLACLAAGPVSVATTCLVVFLGKRLVLPVTPRGIHPVASPFGLRKWIADKLLQASLAATNSLYSTLYTPGWLRSLGARIGPRSEVSTASHLDPGLLTLGAESFVADMAAVGGATYCHGQVALGPTTVGRRSFIGNAAFLRSGTTVGDGCLIGVHTSAPNDGIPNGTSWLGTPPIRLPRRQDSGEYSDELTFRPSRLRVFERFVIEFFRIVVPGSMLAAGGYLVLLLQLWTAQNAGPLATVLATPLSALLGGLAVVLAVAAVKWVVVGRYRPRVEPLWSRFVRRTEFVTALYETAAVPALLGALSGTPLLGPALRLFGAKIGKRCWISTTFLTEFDLVRLGDDTCVGAATSLQTHLFEDRVMKMSAIDVRAGASIGARSVVLYDSAVGDGATVEAMSLVMKGEHLPAETAWQGIPARGIQRQPRLVSDPRQEARQVRAR
ncbi:non-ribosomal peptide synthetase-like protein [Amycolatopsis echigonensis]|uniref:Non-ribosomal peptide synthetase-like protein n=1 Tax=Amycolatopsis echigonensis TaxID=2576905 RepID=A0A2N3X1I5_9PSEU|nr:Pls/PosA family non-ribosomal peptide synthetase [Amycolatopsis niigatensis]PKV99968.1 non-ribosomal peptide synthetase-like protein [Amycolatopsis niigatensis]